MPSIHMCRNTNIVHLLVPVQVYIHTYLYPNDTGIGQVFSELLYVASEGRQGHGGVCGGLRGGLN